MSQEEAEDVRNPSEATGLVGHQASLRMMEEDIEEEEEEEQYFGLFFFVFFVCFFGVFIAQIRIVFFLRKPTQHNTK